MLISDIDIQKILLTPSAEIPTFSEPVSHGCLKYMYFQYYYKFNEISNNFGANAIIPQKLITTTTIVLTPPFRYERVYVHQGNQKCMWYVKSLLVTVQGDH